MASMYCVADYVQETIFVNKPFLKAASVPGSKEYEELLTLRRDNPTYPVQLRTITRNSGKQTHRGLTYDKMEAHIKRNHPGEQERLKALEEVKYRADFNKRGAYALVKKWFLENYGSELSLDELNEANETPDNVVPMAGRN